MYPSCMYIFQGEQETFVYVAILAHQLPFDFYFGSANLWPDCDLRWYALKLWFSTTSRTDSSSNGTTQDCYWLKQTITGCIRPWKLENCIYHRFISVWSRSERHGSCLEEVNMPTQILGNELLLYLGIYQYTHSYPSLESLWCACVCVCDGGRGTIKATEGVQLRPDP